MSRAFVSEDAAASAAALVPERPVSTAPNLVTPAGLAMIEAEAARLERRLGDTPPDDPERLHLARDLRYWRARRLSTQVVGPATGAPDRVAFGTRVGVRRDGSVTAYRIVGEDEADPARGLLSWTSPLATALIGARVGEVVDVGGGRPSVTVERIES